jgi:hypothetical protein
MRPKIFQLVFHVILGNGPNLGAETENSICSGVDLMLLQERWMLQEIFPIDFFNVSMSV